ncbi:LacI family transcriptional regulator [Fulvimarina endophytica]|uniref:LacI family transcriptional regulator n=1 Tax=Fulvimarina endophytica TaxID=2293836 RepID=A0A371X524_9HYPH|nr:LacI family DNA-binding transcriptional regulator [Fulvimarina endophytica]RFC64320.1 LacI family transcriptional regulator [Fulvimarina endophytica]
MAQKVKLSTIADELGVSTATVSLALRDSPLVADQTRDKIKQTARDLGYIYNRRAASLRTSRSGIVGVCVHDVMNPFFGEILKYVEHELDRRRQTFILSNHYDDLSKQRAFVDTLLQLGADGLILSPAVGTPAADIQLAEGNDLPTVLIARTIEGAGVCGFRGDDAFGMALAVDHLIADGHRAIAMVGGTEQTSTGRDRAAGWRSALRKAEIEPRPEWRIEGPRSRDAGFQAGLAFAKMDDRPTAAVCFSDLVALGFMYGLARAGLTPGSDIAVIGYDDIEEAGIATPSLSTVSNGQAEVGHRAAGALLDRLAGNPPSEETVLIRPTLKIRDSSRFRG